MEAVALLSLAVATAVAADDPPSHWRKMDFANGGSLEYRLPLVGSPDYPVDARRAGIQGRSVVRLLVDPAGNILECDVVRSAGMASLDAKACDLYRRRGAFRFSGIDKPQVLHAPIEWRLEE